MSFEKALALTLDLEGGFVDDPADRGGATNQGITQTTHDRFRASIDALPQSVANITDDEVRRIYYDQYWIPGKCADLREPVDAVHFDSCVNVGVARAARFLQAAVGVAVDGIIGPRTLAAVAARDPAQLAQALCDERAQFYREIVQARPDQLRFLKGWLNRVQMVRASIGTETTTV
jgi:lysozyme family protein